VDVDLKGIGERLQQIRKKLGFLQKDFAGELEISSSSLSDIEAGNIKPRFELIYQLIKKFNVDIIYLLNGTGDMFYHEEEEIFHQSAVLTQYRDWFKEFISYFENSPMVRYALMNFFFTYINENEKLIKIDIDNNKAKKGELR
jgi:transcriptional regulator with XRE-family HTH domain